MKKWAALLVVGMAFLAIGCDQPGTSSSSSQQERTSQPVADLSDLVSSGTISLVRANGNGSASGNAIDALFRNNTDSPIDVDVYLREPVFFRNSGVGQNMIASMIVGADGSYMRKSDRQVVTLRPREEFNASVVAYCADFEKENPSASESFSIEQAPPHLAQVIARINAHARSTTNANLTVAAQLAIWMAQGEQPDVIAEKYPFTFEDEQLARQFLQ